MVKDVGNMIEKKNHEVQKMNTLMSAFDGKKGWENVLESHGVLALEDRMRHAKDNATRCHDVVLAAMRGTGIADPEAAAQAISMHRQALLLIADSAKKGQILGSFIKSLADVMDVWVKTNLASRNVPNLQKFACRLQILPKGLVL